MFRSIDMPVCSRPARRRGDLDPFRSLESFLRKMVGKAAAAMPHGSHAKFVFFRTAPGRYAGCAGIKKGPILNCIRWRPDHRRVLREFLPGPGCAFQFFSYLNKFGGIVKKMRVDEASRPHRAPLRTCSRNRGRARTGRSRSCRAAVDRREDLIIPLRPAVCGPSPPSRGSAS